MEETREGKKQVWLETAFEDSGDAIIRDGSLGLVEGLQKVILQCTSEQPDGINMVGTMYLAEIYKTASDALEKIDLQLIAELKKRC